MLSALFNCEVYFILCAEYLNYNIALLNHFKILESFKIEQY